MTTLPANGSHLPHAVEVVTALRNRTLLGDAKVVEVLNAAAVDVGGWAALVVAVGDLAEAFLRGIDTLGTRLLADETRLTEALAAVIAGAPLTSADLGTDPGSVLDRIGRLVASFPT